VAARSQGWVCDRSLDEIAGSNPAQNVDFLSVVSVACCTGRGGMRRADHSSRGALQIVCVCVIEYDVGARISPCTYNE
jgi:hypothetical protein